MAQKNSQGNKKTHPEGLRTWIEIDRKALQHNYQVFRHLIPKSCRLMAVVKSNAYGHGLVDFSLAAQALGVDWLGVDSIKESLTLRKAGLQTPILVLGYTLDENLALAIRHKISVTVASLEDLLRLSQGGWPLKTHLKIDTGMHRQGLFLKELPLALGMMRRPACRLIIEGVYTHFASAKNPASLKATQRQIKLFKQAASLLETNLGKRVLKHAAATGGTLIFPESYFDMVRIGIGLYGLWPSAETRAVFGRQIHLKPILSWKTIVAAVKSLPAGSRLGYDLIEAVKRPSRLALLPVGYWHGYPRALSSRGRVIINGRRAKVLGRVCMDMTTVDVTDIAKAKPGVEVLLLGGGDGRQSIPAEELAQLGGTINYEILTRLNPLIKKFYL